MSQDKELKKEESLKFIKKKEKIMSKVLITTEFRGVFYGDVKDDKKLPDEITLNNVRNCIYWSSNCNGFLGLASKGPTPECRIGAKVKEIKLYKITSVTPVSKEAGELWDKA